MKKFMLLFVGTDYDALGFSPEEMQQRIGRWGAWSKKMQEDGILLGGERLYGHSRVIAGVDKIPTDRTAAEVKELVGGFFMIEAPDMDAAQKVAQDGYPDYDTGNTVEIREIMSYS